MSRDGLIPAINALKALLLGKTIMGIGCDEELQASFREAILLLEESQPTCDEIYVLEFDGASKGNPGPAGLGAIIYDSFGNIVEKQGKSLPDTTNNVAEYRALIAGLEMAVRLGTKHLAIRTDSELVARQLNGEYKIRKPELIELVAIVKSLLAQLKSYTIKHIPRELNVTADKLASAAIKEKVAREKRKQ